MLRVMWIVAAVACSNKSPPPAQPPAPAAIVADAGVAADAPLDQDLPRLAERSLALYHDVAQTFATARQDCAAATARLRTLADSYHDVVAANAKVLHDGRARELRAVLEPHSEDFDHTAQAIMQAPTMSKCSQDPAFAKAFDELLAPP